MRLKLSLLLVFIVTYSWSQGSTKTFTGNGTFPVPAGVTNATVQAWGGGGSGGGAGGAPLLLGRGAAGGGGGAYARNNIVVTPGTTLNVVVASQTAGTTGAGTAGGYSTIIGFESSILAAGGSGGDANNSGGSPVGGIGGTVAASAGTTRLAGTNGGNGNSWNLLGLLLSSGAGGAGASFGGAGGTAVSGLLLSNAPGNAGSPPGGGGSGAINSALGAAQIGGAGAAGRITITYSCANFSLTSTAATNVCGSTGTTSTVTLTGSAASLPVGNYVVTYNRSSPSATALTANLAVTTAGTGTFTAVGLTAAGSSTITITNLTSESCSSNITSNNTAVVTVSAATVGGTISGGTTVCAGSTSGVLTLSGQTGSVVKWQSSVSPFSTWTDIANTTTTYTSGALTETTQFRAVVQSGACTAVNSAAATVTVSPATVGGIVSGGTSVNVGSTSGLLTLSGHTGSVLKWQSSVSPFSTWTDIANTTTTYTSGVLSETTQFRAVVQSGVCAIANSETTTVTVNPIPTIALASSAQTRCSTNDGSPSSTTLQYTATTENPTTYSIVWNASPANSFATVIDAALPASPIEIAIPANVVPDTYTGTLIVKNANGAVSTGSIFTVTILETPLITTTGIIDAVNTSTSSQNTTLAYSGVTGNPTSYFINWTAGLEDQVTTPFAFSSGGGTINTIVVSANVPAGTYTGIMYISTELCSQSQFVSIVINNPAPTIALASSAQTRCSTNDGSSSTTTLEYSATTESPTTYSIVWDASPANSFAAVTDAALPASPIDIAIPGGVVPGTYSGTLTVKNANGAVSTGSAFTVTINETPLITTTGTIDAVCRSSSSQNATLSYSGVTGNPTSYFIDWNGPANDASLADQPSTPFAFSSWGGSIDSIVIPGGVPPGTYAGVMYIYNGVCNQSQLVSIQVNELPDIPVASSTTDVCFNTEEQFLGLIIGDDLATGSPTTYSIAWDASPANSFAAVVDAPLPTYSILIPVPGETAPGTYTGILTVKNANGCVSSGSSFTVTVNETPSITTTGTINAVCSSNNAQTTQLQYTASSGNPTSYSIDWDQAANDALLEDKPTTSFAFASSGGFIGITIPANVLPGTYSGTIVVNNELCYGSYPISIVVSTGLVGGTVTGGTTISSGSTSGLLTLSGTTAFVVKWQSSVSPFTTWSDIANTNTTYTSGPLTETTKFRAVVQRGTCFAVNSEPTTVTVAILPTIALASWAENVCIGNFSTGEVTTLSYSGTTGEPVTYSIVWYPLPVNGFEPITDAVLPVSPITISLPLGVEEGTYTGTLTVKDANGNTSLGSDFNILVAYRPVIISSGTINPIAASITTQNAVLAYDGITANPSSYYIDWDQAANNASLQDQPSTPFAFSSWGGTIDSIVIPADVPAGTYSGTMYFVNDSPCIGSKPISIVINGLPTIDLASSAENVCSNLGYNETETALSYKGTTGDPVTYSIVWDSSPANTFAAVNDAVLPASPITITIPEDTLEGTYTGTLTVKDANGVSSLGSIFNLSIGLTPAIIIYEPINPVCASTNSQNAILPYYGTESNPTSYYIDWDETANNALLQDQGITPVTLDHNGGTIDSIVISANAEAGSYSGTLHLVEGFCTGSVPISIVINPLTKTPIVGEITPPTSEVPTGSVVLNGLPTDDWTIVKSPGGEVRPGSGSSITYANLAPGEYTFTVTADGGCTSLPTEIVVIPNAAWERSASKQIESPDLEVEKSTSVTAFNHIINVETINQTINQVSVFDVSGNLLYNKNKVSDSKLVITDLRSSNQVLIVKVILSDNRVATKKVIY